MDEAEFQEIKNLNSKRNSKVSLECVEILADSKNNNSMINDLSQECTSYTLIGVFLKLPADEFINYMFERLKKMILNPSKAEQCEDVKMDEDKIQRPVSESDTANLTNKGLINDAEIEEEIFENRDDEKNGPRNTFLIKKPLLFIGLLVVAVIIGIFAYQRGVQQEAEQKVLSQKSLEQAQLAADQEAHDQKIASAKDELIKLFDDNNAYPRTTFSDSLLSKTKEYSGWKQRLTDLVAKYNSVTKAEAPYDTSNLNTQLSDYKNEMTQLDDKIAKYESDLNGINADVACRFVWLCSWRPRQQ